MSLQLLPDLTAEEFQPDSVVIKRTREAKETAKALIQHFADEGDDEL